MGLNSAEKELGKLEARPPQISKDKSRAAARISCPIWLALSTTDKEIPCPGRISFRIRTSTELN